MIAVMISSSGASWTFYAAAGDKVFLVENKSPPDDKLGEAMEHLIREARWMFGDQRIIMLNRDDDWVECIHDGAGHIKGFEQYDGPIPQEEADDEQDA
jgi:hypothetical protein